MVIPSRPDKANLLRHALTQLEKPTCPECAEWLTAHGFSVEGYAPRGISHARPHGLGAAPMTARVYETRADEFPEIRRAADLLAAGSFGHAGLLIVCDVPGPSWPWSRPFRRRCKARAHGLPEELFGEHCNLQRDHEDWPHVAEPGMYAVAWWAK